ncbi:hypothetical protein KM043_009150 [Ampulex compressa]|nr:hypothetical protein KM043_009150 [Ampulex compressa]
MVKARVKGVKSGMSAARAEKNHTVRPKDIRDGGSKMRPKVSKIRRCASLLSRENRSVYNAKRGWANGPGNDVERRETRKRGYKKKQEMKCDVAPREGGIKGKLCGEGDTQKPWEEQRGNIEDGNRPAPGPAGTREFRDRGRGSQREETQESKVGRWREEEEEKEKQNAEKGEHNVEESWGTASWCARYGRISGKEVRRGKQSRDERGRTPCRAAAAGWIRVKRWEPCRPGELPSRQPAGSSSYRLYVVLRGYRQFLLAFAEGVPQMRRKSNVAREPDEVISKQGRDSFAS